MKFLRCLALDDEPLALELLEDNIRTIPFLQLVHSCQSSMEAMQVLQSGQIDLVFSDIQMPGLNGLQLITALPVKPMFVLITAHEKFALEGYALDVVDYLLKPVAYERFVKACNKALERHKLRQQGASSIAGTTVEAREFFFVPIDYKMVKIALNEVLRVEGVRDYIRVHFIPKRQPLLVRMSMKAAEDALPKSKFIRIHKSHIVNISSITAVRKSTMFIDDIELPVGEQYRVGVQSLVNG